MYSLHKRPLIFGGVVVGISMVWAWGWTPDDFSDPDCDLTNNAAWISVDWTSQPIDGLAVEQLASSAERRGIHSLFTYTSYLKRDGTFSESYGNASEFVSAFRKLDTDTRLLAWIGIPLTNPHPIGVQGWVDLSNPETRQQIVDFVGELLLETGFDGVHVNAETVQNNDASFLLLLEEIREVVGPHKMVSIAGSHWIPDTIGALPLLGDLRWTSGYYQEVSRRVDQIATMTYDSYSPHPSVYRLWMREQVRGIGRSLGDSGTELLIGISVSQENTRSHHPSAEPLRAGLAGLCAGLPDPQIIDGVAIYADWEFPQADGQTWDQWRQ